jgi:hypothetical protein
VPRDAEEEIGIKLEKDNGKLIDTYTGNDFIKDVYLFTKNVNIEETKLQADEAINIK